VTPCSLYSKLTGRRDVHTSADHAYHQMIK
jgi:hypothetical protein